MILGGDITGKMIVPIVVQPDGSHKCHFLNRDYIARTREELLKLEDTVRLNGFYPYQTTPQEMEELSTNNSKVASLFSHLMIETLERYLKMAKERLEPAGIRCYITGGNDDLFEIEPVLNNSDYVINPEGKVVNITEHHEMISSGYSNITPWNCPRDIAEDKLSEKIQNMASQVKDMKNCIFSLHCPPYNTGIDTALELNKDLKIVTQGGRPHEIPVGSTAVRAAIEKFQPLMGFHGHIHESRGAVKLGRTLCFNPGSEYSEGILRGVIVDLDKNGIKSYTFTSG